METTKISMRLPNVIAESLIKEADARGTSLTAVVVELLEGSMVKPVKQNYVQVKQKEEEMKSASECVADIEVARNQAAAEKAFTEELKYQEAFQLADTSIIPPMLQIMTANRRRIKGLAYDKSMEQYFHLIKPSKQNSPSRLNNG